MVLVILLSCAASIRLARNIVMAVPIMLKLRASLAVLAGIVILK
ncbi:hypothetical protein COO91_10571 (plasmid) [Nostoc flagelliforme CCNUN1]|uniref:Uncharacterized protein n=1 Tax=Nostoc flagelliforme CCNUN1 TaxID=2038116 RepID=A0A2K8T9H9_9NOSO|nr:hypothetical protein COO91_10571 [Nostoc flagelliforme CCNUN1]